MTKQDYDFTGEIETALALEVEKVKSRIPFDVKKLAHQRFQHMIFMELRRVFEASDLSEDDLCNRLQYSKYHLNQYLDGIKPLTLEMYAELMLAMEHYPTVRGYSALEYDPNTITAKRRQDVKA